MLAEDLLESYRLHGKTALFVQLTFPLTVFSRRADIVGAHIQISKAALCAFGSERYSRLFAFTTALRRPAPNLLSISSDAEDEALMLPG